MIKNILVPYDFTNFADLAFENALELAEKLGSKITLLSVIGNDVDTSGMSFERAQEAQDENEKQAKEDLDKLSASRKIKNVDVSVSIVHFPSAVDGILSYADKNNVDLIVMGSHGRSGLKKLVLGSVASGVVSKANCRVMIVKSPKT